MFSFRNILERFGLLTTKSEPVTLVPHRWSGWPGAWCLDCGQGDPAEACINAHDATYFILDCQEHPDTSCPEPGSNRHNPYVITNNA